MATAPLRKNEDQALNPSAIDNTKSKAQELFSKVSPRTKNKLTFLLANLSKLKGKDRTFAIATAFASVAKDTGLADSVLTRDQFNDAISTFDLAANWDKQSDISKYTAAGKQLVNLANKYGGADIQYAGDALSLAQFGYSQYQLVNNWDKLNDVQRLVGLSHTIQASNAAYGAGANLFSAAATAGEAGVATASAANASAASSSSAAAGSTTTTTSTGSTLLSAAGWIGAAYGAYTLYTTYGNGSADNRKTGAVSGAAVGAMFGPIGAAIGAVVGVGIGSVKAGKSVEQQARDNYRDYYYEVGVFDTIKDYEVNEKKGTADIRGVNFDPTKVKGENQVIQLADGSFYNVGDDGSKSRALYQGKDKTFYDPSKLNVNDVDGVNEDNSLRPYNIDYTNDLDFFAGHSLKALEVSLAGGSKLGKESTEYGQLTGYLANAATSNAASRDFTEDNFKTTMSNVRNMYAKAGITNSDQAHNLLTQLLNEDKISQGEFDEAAAGIRVAFNNDFKFAQELSKTRWTDVETVGKKSTFVNDGEPLPDGTYPPETTPAVNIGEGLGKIVDPNAPKESVALSETELNPTEEQEAQAAQALANGELTSQTRGI